MTFKCISLLSGGLDSVVNFHLAIQEGEVIQALTFDYGQRSARQEIKAARYFCDKKKVPHTVIELPWLKTLTKTALVDTQADLPSLKDLDDLNEGNQSAKKVWVPNRNGVFLNIAASFAESLEADYIVPGFNKEEAATFPDNSEDFILASNHAFKLSTLSHVKVKCFTTDLDKRAMIKKANALGVELGKVWSCYEGGDIPCQKCESCQRTLRALK